MGVTIPKEWGGAGADYVSYVLALEEIARASATLAVILVVILASAGYRRGSILERLYRDVRAAEIYPGTSEVQRMLISGAVLRKQATGRAIKRRPDTPAPRSSA
jgi:alkylation response protein AidB-like acyl-CoA dehydrogenase